MEDLSKNDLIDFAESNNFPELIQVIEGKNKLNKYNIGILIVFFFKTMSLKAML
jgi:hypothetical protein